jgi:predicted phosphodiesterase
MRIGFISDTHGNLVALEAVLKTIQADRIISLGDTIGYYCFPNECMDLIRDRTDVQVLGNHEDYALHMLKGEPLSGVSTSILATASWTLEELTDENIAYLQKMEYVHNEDDSHFSHNGVPPKWNYYLSNPLEILNLRNPYRFRVFGHLHRPEVMTRNGSVWGFQPEEDAVYDLSRADQSVIIAPSVGMPRDFKPLAGFAVLDTTTDLLEIRRIGYDKDLMIKEMKRHPTYPSSQILTDTLKFGGDVSYLYNQGITPT